MKTVCVSLQISSQTSYFERAKRSERQSWNAKARVGGNKTWEPLAAFEQRVEKRLQRQRRFLATAPKGSFSRVIPKTNHGSASEIAGSSQRDSGSVKQLCCVFWRFTLWFRREIESQKGRSSTGSPLDYCSDQGHQPFDRGGNGIDRP